MIKATINKPDGSVLLILGISGEGMARLMSDEPILIRYEQLRELIGNELDRDGHFDIAIMGGKDEATIRATLEPYIGPHTVIHDV